MLKGLKIAFALVTTRIATRKKAPFLCVQEPGREGDYIIYKKGPWKGLTQVTTLAHGGWVANIRSMIRSTIYKSIHTRGKLYAPPESPDLYLHLTSRALLLYRHAPTHSTKAVPRPTATHDRCACGASWDWNRWSIIRLVATVRLHSASRRTGARHCF